MRRPIAFVVQRYGAEVTGGSESLAREVAERLSAEYPIAVFTSCARDYATWRNELPEGRATVNGVEVRRFPSQEERDLDRFNAFAEPLYRRSPSAEEEHLWLRRQGPYLPGLVRALESERDYFAAFVFFTYLYYPTYWGLKAVAGRSDLVPTAHDEPPLRFGIYREVFGWPRAFVFCSSPEEALVRSRFALGDRPATVAGIGIDLPERADVEELRKHHLLPREYVLYAGRIDAGKGCDEMLRFFARYRAEKASVVELLLIGRLNMELPPIPGVRYLGYLSEDEKRAALAGARVVLCPSPYESLSIVLLEGLALGTPALVTARSAVLKDHCLRSNAGLYYADGDEFALALDLLLKQDRLRSAMGDNGRRYVRDNYRWETVLGKYRAMIETVAGHHPRP